jgi:uncharacterized OB-fold protein
MMRSAGPAEDWTTGIDAIQFQKCRSCDATWYFRRSFCPMCGDAAPQTRTASGWGIVHSTTIIYRAPSRELQAAIPYLLCLVDAEERFRLMAHGTNDLVIGDVVYAGFRSFGSGIVPFFEKAAR